MVVQRFAWRTFVVLLVLFSVSGTARCSDAAVVHLGSFAVPWPKETTTALPLDLCGQGTQVEFSLLAPLRTRDAGQTLPVERLRLQVGERNYPLSEVPVSVSAEDLLAVQAALQCRLSPEDAPGVYETLLVVQPQAGGQDSGFGIFLRVEVKPWFRLVSRMLPHQQTGIHLASGPSFQRHWTAGTVYIASNTRWQLLGVVQPEAVGLAALRVDGSWTMAGQSTAVLATGEATVDSDRYWQALPWELMLAGSVNPSDVDDVPLSFRLSASADWRDEGLLQSQLNGEE